LSLKKQIDVKLQFIFDRKLRTEIFIPSERDIGQRVPQHGTELNYDEQEAQTAVVEL
jgi:hypothetical protein